MQKKFISYSSANPPSLLRKAATGVVLLAVAGITLMFSAILLSFIVVVGAIAGAYLWWKTRELRKQMQAQMQNFQARSASMEREPFDGNVIDGEVVRVDVSRDGNPR